MSVNKEDCCPVCGYWKRYEVSISASGSIDDWVKASIKINNVNSCLYVCKKCGIMYIPRKYLKRFED